MPMTGTLPPEHPLRGAQWVWPEFYMYLHNHFAQFRWDVELEQVAASVPLFVTADKSYRLYVNGTAVCRGPARGYQAHWPFDEVDLAPYLRPGHNWLSVEAFQPGCSTFQYLHQNYAGLLVASSDPELSEQMRANPPAMRRSPGHRRQTARYSLQIDFQEQLDLRADDRRWITHPERPEGWVAEIFPPVAQKFLAAPFGRAPYYDVEPRGVPLLREGLLVPHLSTVTATGDCAPGYESVENVSWHWVGEAQGVAEWVPADALDARRDEDWLTLTLPAVGTGRFVAAVIPVGEYTLGAIVVEAEGATGGEILDFQHDQFFRDGRPHFVPPGDASMVALGNRLILRPGDNAHEFYHPLGFGALTLIGRDLTRPLTVRLRVRTAGYPFTMRGAFDCSDPLLNTIHAACRRTQQLCALDAYMDTPWREQAQWWGDARVQARNTFFLDGDARLLARGIRSLAGQSVMGLTPGHAPTSSYWCVLPDFALTWILTIWDHYWQTGDIALFREQRGRIDEVLYYFDNPDLRDADGLLRYDRRTWLFEDWSTLPKQEVPTFLNLWYALTLEHLGRLCALAGDDGGAADFADRSRRHTDTVVARLFDTGRDLLLPALDAEGKPYGEPSVHDQTLALMLGIVPEAHEGMMQGVLLPYLRGEKPAGAAPSAFWATYVLEQAILRGHAAEAISFIRTRWEPMMGTGTTWEDFHWNEESGGSACHAWTAHPSFHLVNALAGIFQTGPAWSSIDLRPAFLPDLDHAAALVPAPPGNIRSAWRRGPDGRITWEVTIPEGVAATAHLPGQADPVRLAPGLHTLTVTPA
jgi:hypothetical protein